MSLIGSSFNTAQADLQLVTLTLRLPPANKSLLTSTYCTVLYIQHNPRNGKDEHTARDIWRPVHWETALHHLQTTSRLQVLYNIVLISKRAGPTPSSVRSLAWPLCTAVLLFTFIQWHADSPPVNQHGKTAERLRAPAWGSMQIME